MNTTPPAASGSAATIERFELSPGVFVYRRPGVNGEDDCLCPACFETGETSILRRSETTQAVHCVCPRCDARFLERKKPLTNLAMSPWSGF